MNQLSINVFHVAVAILFAFQIGNYEPQSTFAFNNLLADMSIEAVAWLNLAEHNVV